jgi:hypothetical protein
MTLPADVARCAGVATMFDRLAEPCRECLRMTTPPIHPWAPYLTPPAVRDGSQWRCPQRIPSQQQPAIGQSAEPADQQPDAATRPAK